MTQTQFEAAMKRRGFVRQPFLGYWQLPIDGRRVCVSELNGGKRRRDRLAYMIRELERQKDR